MPNKKMIKVLRGGFVPLKEFSDVVDIDKITTYSLKVNKDNSITLKFFDLQDKSVRPYGSK